MKDQNKQIQSIYKTIEITDIKSVLTLAKELSNFIKQNNLITKLKDKDYVNVEGWQYAGLRLGIIPIIDFFEKVQDTPNEIKYICKVNLIHYSSGRKVGYGSAVCSNKEFTKRDFQEYAIASMAQTRAIGKAFRNSIAWLIKASGFEPTPAEEIHFQNSDDELHIDNLKKIEALKKIIDNSKNKEQLEKIWSNNKELQSEEIFIEMVNNKKNLFQ